MRRVVTIEAKDEAERVRITVQFDSNRYYYKKDEVERRIENLTDKVYEVLSDIFHVSNIRIR